MSDGTNSTEQRAPNAHEVSAEILLAWSRAQVFLTEQEVYVLEKRLFLPPGTRPPSFAKIGDEMGRSSSRVQEIYRRACDKLSVRPDTWALAEQLLNPSATMASRDADSSTSMRAASDSLERHPETPTDLEESSEDEPEEEPEDEPEEELPEDLHELLQVVLGKVTTALPLCQSEGLDEVVRILSRTQHRIRLGIEELLTTQVPTPKRSVAPVQAPEPLDAMALEPAVHEGLARQDLRPKVDEEEKARRLAMYERVLRGELSQSTAARALGIKRSTWQAWLSYQPRRKTARITASAPNTASAPITASAPTTASEQSVAPTTTKKDAHLPKPQPIVSALPLDDLVEQLQRIQRFQEGVRERLRDLVEYVDAHR